jgi:nitrogen fixation NifU-like protein
MEDILDDFAAGLQSQIFEDTRKTYGEEISSRWRQPKFMGKMTNATCMGRVTGTCGDSIEIYLRVENDRIREASFFTEGCGISVACGSVAAELAIGKDVDEVASIGGDTILEVLRGLPDAERHCAFLAANALQAAIHEWMVQGRKTEIGVGPS